MDNLMLWSFLALLTLGQCTPLTTSFPNPEDDFIVDDHLLPVSTTEAQRKNTTLPLADIFEGSGISEIPETNPKASILISTTTQVPLSEDKTSEYGSGFTFLFEDFTTTATGQTTTGQTTSGHTTIGETTIGQTTTGQTTSGHTTIGETTIGQTTIGQTTTELTTKGHTTTGQTSIGETTIGQTTIGQTTTELTTKGHTTIGQTTTEETTTTGFTWTTAGPIRGKGRGMFPVIKETTPTSTTTTGSGVTEEGLGVTEEPEVTEGSKVTGKVLGVTEGSEVTDEVTEERIVAVIGSKDSSSFENLLSYTAPIERPTESPDRKGHVTPDWIIIVAFVVALAAFILLCLAIATRDKWNAPNQNNKTMKTLPSASQQRAAEKEAFLQKNQPKENGKAEEYTVIPLDKLPHEYMS